MRIVWYVMRDPKHSHAVDAYPPTKEHDSKENATKAARAPGDYPQEDDE